VPKIRITRKRFQKDNKEEVSKGSPVIGCCVLYITRSFMSKVEL
jgi:hypothetical protein